MLERKHAERFAYKPKSLEYYQTDREKPPEFKSLSTAGSASCGSTPGGGRKKYPHASKQDLSSCRAALLELMQSINFGRIEKLSLRNGEPVLSPRPTIVRKHKFGGDNGPRPELGTPDFLLKQQIVELLAYLDDRQNGVIDELEIKHGLPFRVIIAEVSA